MNVTFTLTAATSGTTAATSFNISGTTSGGTTTELATAVTKSQLTTGHTINSVNDAITGGTIASISPNSCTGVTTTWLIIQPTPTPTPTVTPTPVPGVNTRINVYSGTSISAACDMLHGPFSVFHTGNLVTGAQLWIDGAFTNTVAGTSIQPIYYYFSEYNEVRRVNDSDGHIGGSLSCPTATPTTGTITNAIISTVGGQEACDGGDDGLSQFYTLTIYGSDIQNASGIVSLPAEVLADFSNNQQFWVKGRSSGQFYWKKFILDGNVGPSQTSSSSGSATLCVYV